MRKILGIAVICGCLSVASLPAEEEEISYYERISPDELPCCCVRVCNYPHHVAFNPEIFFAHFNIEDDCYHVKDTRFFAGARLRYEYLKRESFYFGAELLGAFTNQEFDLSIKTPYGKFELEGAHKILTYLSGEGRFGYTFAPCNYLVTPFLGIGGYDLEHLTREHRGFEQVAGYIAAGVRTMYLWSDNFNLGLNLKVFGTFTAKELKERNNMWGGEISLPWVWFVDCANRFNVQLEPYFLRLDFSEIENIYGLKLVFEYRF